MKNKAGNKLADTKNEEVDLSTSMILDNIINTKFNEDEWDKGIDYISKYCAMYVSLRNCAIEEDSCIEILKTIINKE